MIFAERRLTSLFLPLISIIFAVVSGCASTPEALDAAGKPLPKPASSLEALLYSKGGSSIHGDVSLAVRGESWLITANIWSGIPNAKYRMVFFDNGNCSSPNAFSAGKLWAPPDTPKDPATWIPLFYVDSVGAGEMVTRLPNPGKHDIDTFRKRSVLVFDGPVEPLKPGVKNNVVACGVFETPISLIDELF